MPPAPKVPGPLPASSSWAVAQAHSVGIAHGDLKTENVFVSSWFHAVLVDFAQQVPFELLPGLTVSQISDKIGFAPYKLRFSGHKLVIG